MEQSASERGRVQSSLEQRRHGNAVQDESLFQASQSVVALRSSGIVIFWSATASGFIISLAESGKALLLRERVDIRPDDEGDEVEERHPGVLGQELLRKGEAQRRCDPADLCDGPKARFPGGMDLVDGLGAGDDGHRDQIHCVLDRRNLVPAPLAYIFQPGLQFERTIKLLARIWRIFAFRLVRPEKSLCRMLIKTCPRGALIKAPYAAIFGTRDVK